MGKQTGVWPELARVDEFKDSATQTRRYFRFSNGLTIWTINNGPASMLKAA